MEVTRALHVRTEVTQSQSQSRPRTAPGAGGTRGIAPRSSDAGRCSRLSVASVRAGCRLPRPGVGRRRAIPEIQPCRICTDICTREFAKLRCVMLWLNRVNNTAVKFRLWLKHQTAGRERVDVHDRGSGGVVQTRKYMHAESRSCAQKVPLVQRACRLCTRASTAARTLQRVSASRSADGTQHITRKRGRG